MDTLPILVSPPPSDHRLTPSVQSGFSLLRDSERFHTGLVPRPPVEKSYAFQLFHICISGVLGLGHFCTQSLVHDTYCQSEIRSGHVVFINI